MRVRCLCPDELRASDLAAWAALEHEALQPNAYMSPHFVLPALRHLGRPHGTKLVLVERVHRGDRHWVALAVTRPVAAARLLPLPHQALYQSRHSYLGAPLVHREFAADAAAVLFDRMIRGRWSAAGLMLPNVDPAGPLLPSLADAVRAHGLALQTSPAWQRATLVPARAGAGSVRMCRKHKELERCRRRLAQQGELHWVVHRESVSGEVIEDFLRLEHSGWKGRGRTSLRSRPGDEAFFREMTAGFAAEGRAFFAELRLNGKTIASNSNFVSGHAGFAFKLGWDEAFRKYCIGMLNDAELVYRAPELCGDLVEIDSGSSAGSFMEMLWPHRRSLVMAFLPYSPAGQAAWRSMQSLRSLRNSARARLRGWRVEPALPR